MHPYHLRRLEVVRSENDWFAEMITEWVKVANTRSTDNSEHSSDASALIRILRDTTDSASIHARCVAIVGDRS